MKIKTLILSLIHTSLQCVAPLDCKEIIAWYNLILWQWCWHSAEYSSSEYRAYYIYYTNDYHDHKTTKKEQEQEKVCIPFLNYLNLNKETFVTQKPIPDVVLWWEY